MTSVEGGPRGLLSTIGIAALCAGAFSLPLAAVPTVYDAFILPKLLLGRAIVAILAVLLVVRWWWTGHVDIRRTPLDVPLALFVCAALASTVGSVSMNLSFVGSYLRYDGWSTLATYAALFWLAAQTLATARDAQLVLRSLLASGAVASVIAVGQVLQAGPLANGETATTFGGLLRPDATFANPNSLAIFLAMVLPLGLQELVAARSITARLLSLVASLLVAIALLLTFSRSAWIGALIGVGLLLAFMIERHRFRTAFIAIVVCVIAAGLLVLFGATAPATALVARIASFADPASGSVGTRLGIWADAINLIVDRPVFGYGLDTFGLVYPHFQSEDWTPGGKIDKAHAEVLQIAATQGLLGVAIYGAMIVATIRAFSSRRVRTLGIGVFGAWVAYQVTLQPNFTSLAAAQPFWLLTAAGLQSWDAVRTKPVVLARIPAAAVGGAASALLVAAITWTGLRAYTADARFLVSLDAAARGRQVSAQTAIDEARRLAPEREQYAALAGDLAIAAARRSGKVDAWEAARDGYEAAAALGASDPALFRKLAVVYAQLGRDHDAEKASRFASALAPFD